MAGLDAPKVLVLRPGGAPLGQLAEVVSRVPGIGQVSEKSLKTPTEAGQFEALHKLFATVMLRDKSRFVLVIDQFEELFTECTDAASRTAFLENLAFAAANPDRLASVVITLRSDFAGAVRAPMSFASAVRESRLIVQAMDRDELKDSIARPALELGHPWPPSLVDALVAQTEGRAGALPLLQFALTQLWPEHVGGRLTDASWSSS